MALLLSWQLPLQSGLDKMKFINGRLEHLHSADNADVVMTTFMVCFYWTWKWWWWWWWWWCHVCMVLGSAVLWEGVEGSARQLWNNENTWITLCFGRWYWQTHPCQSMHVYYTPGSFAQTAYSVCSAMNMVKWSWWDWSRRSYVLWHCHLGQNSAGSSRRLTEKTVL